MNVSPVFADGSCHCPRAGSRSLLGGRTTIGYPPSAVHTATIAQRHRTAACCSLPTSERRSLAASGPMPLRWSVNAPRRSVANSRTLIALLLRQVLLQGRRGRAPSFAFEKEARGAAAAPEAGRPGPAAAWTEARPGPEQGSAGRTAPRIAFTARCPALPMAGHFSFVWSSDAGPSHDRTIPARGRATRCGRLGDVAQQQQLIAQREVDGHDTVRARALLKTYQLILKVLEAGATSCGRSYSSVYSSALSCTSWCKAATHPGPWLVFP